MSQPTPRLKLNIYCSCTCMVIELKIWDMTFYIMFFSQFFHYNSFRITIKQSNLLNDDATMSTGFGAVPVAVDDFIRQLASDTYQHVNFLPLHSTMLTLGPLHNSSYFAFTHKGFDSISPGKVCVDKLIEELRFACSREHKRRLCYLYTIQSKRDPCPSNRSVCIYIKKLNLSNQTKIISYLNI